MKRKLLFFINPISGTRNKQNIESIIRKKCTKYEFDFDIAFTNAAGKYHDVEHKIIDQGFSDIIIVGGDGTVNQLTNKFKHLNLPFGIIPMGSGNGLAFAANIPANFLKALKTVFVGNTTEVDVETIAVKMYKQGIRWTISDKSSGSRKRGLQIIRDRLQASLCGEGPGLYFMDNCIASISLLPELPRDEDDPDDIDTTSEDHAYDMVRYRCTKGNNREAKYIDVRHIT